VLLPAVAVLQDSASEQPQRGADLTGQGTVLIIDDEEVVRSLAERALKNYGYTVLLAKDGEQGLKLFRESADSIRCILLDLTMPSMNGEETLHRLRGIRTDIPVILSSGFDEIEVVSRFEGQGLAGFLQKPYKSTMLVEKVGEVIALSGPHPGAGQEES
jgi:DNA-binding NtrC family response regulator